MKATLLTAGERLRITSSVDWVSQLIAECAGSALKQGEDAGIFSAAIQVEARDDAFATEGWELLTRGAWRRDGQLVVTDVCGTGFDMQVVLGSPGPSFTYRWRPTARHQAMRFVLASRFVLLARDVLLHYPATWCASLDGRAPLHACAVSTAGACALLAGPGGVGKSTLVAEEAASGGRTVGDNLCVSDGVTVWGLVEPARLEGGAGRRMPHRRGELQLAGRVPSLNPSCVVVLRRGLRDQAEIRRCSPREAVASLVSGTYMAGELRRYWSFAATLSAALRHAIHPPILAVADELGRRLPCIELQLPRTPGFTLAQAFQRMEVLA